MKQKVLVVGGGAAGMTAAVFAARSGAEVSLFERNEKLGKKIYITGKGRCNFTNACPKEDFLSHVVRNPRFLYSSFGRFSNQDTLDLFDSLHMPYVIERGNRAFPKSGHASDVTRALSDEMKRLGVRTFLNSRVSEIIMNENETAAAGIRLEDGHIVRGDRVIVATGGLSYPSTGSTGDGYRFAEDAGLRVKETRPSLSALLVSEPYISCLEGLSLKNVALTIRCGEKKKDRWSGFGEMVFTANGISGPLALTASAWIGGRLSDGPLSASIDLKPTLTEQQLDGRILREFGKSENKTVKNVIPALYPSKIRPVILELAGIHPDLPVHDVTKKMRNRLIEATRRFPLTVTGTEGYNRAVVTSGGVDVREIDPKTMESRKIRGLFFAGEVLDVDAVTGGFNLQIAWTTGFAAGTAAAEGN